VRLVVAKKDKKPWRDKLSLAATLLTVGIVAVFLGYIMGHYAIRLMAEPLMKPTTTTSRPRQSPQSPLDEAVEPEPIEEELPPTPPPQVVKPPKTDVLFRVQVGAFQEEENARRLGEKLKEEENLPVYLSPGPPYRVQVGAFSERKNAEALRSKLQAKGYEAIVTQ
jgi:cell division septation protein DedD